MSNSVWSHRQQPIRLPCPWDSPGKNTGVGCHFLLQCMKVKSESEVAQLCPTLSDPVDWSLPGSSVHGISQERVLEWAAIAFSNNSKTTFFSKYCIYLFIWLRQVLVVPHGVFVASACRIFSCRAQTLWLWCSSSVAMVLGLSFSVACGILVPWPGIEPMSCAQQGLFLTTEP